MIKLNRIGNKLGLAGAVGVLLAVGMVANQMITESRIEEGSARATRSQQVADNSLAAHIDLRKIQLAAADVRLARTPAAVEKTVADLQRHKASQAKELEAALAMAQRPDARDRLQKISASMESFAAAVEDLAKAQTTLLAQIDKRSVVSEEWNKAIAAQLGSPAMAKVDNRLEIERLLFQADARVNALRAAAWKLGATGDANLVTAMAKTEASLKDVFNKLRGEADDRDLLVVVSNLSSIVKRFLAANEEAVRTEQSKNAIIADRTVKAAADVADLMEATVVGAQKDARTSKDEVMDDTERANQINLIMAIVVVMSLIASVVFSFLGVARPMTRLNGALGEMAGGNLDVEIPGAGRGDEIGDLAKTVTVIRENAEQKAREEAEAKNKQDEDRSGEAQGGNDQDGGRFRGRGRQDRRDRVVGLDRTRDLGEHADIDADAFARTRHHGGRASEEASTNVQSVASSTEEMTVVGHTRSAARCRNRRGWPTRPSIRRGTTNDRVSELSKAAARIGEVVELINTIAGQTNLLALNATIEAARAGEAGRGFAVVASEVKALAEQTSKATGEIGQQITGIQAATHESVGAIQEISGTIEKLSEISSTIAAAVEEQGAATQEISRNVQQAARGTRRSPPTSPACSGRQRDRHGLVPGALRGAVAVAGTQPPQARSRQVPRLGARGISRGQAASQTARLRNTGAGVFYLRIRGGRCRPRIPTVTQS